MKHTRDLWISIFTQVLAATSVKRPNSAIYEAKKAADEAVKVILERFPADLQEPSIHSVQAVGPIPAVTVMEVQEPQDDWPVERLLRFGQCWSDLGDAVQEQAIEVINGVDDADTNPEAIRIAAEDLVDFPEIADALQAWLARG